MDEYRRGVYSSTASLDEEDISDDEASYDASAQGEVSEIEEWVSRERLPRKTSGILLDHGLTTLHDLRQLSTDFVTDFLLQTGLLPPVTCMALSEALERLTVSGGSAPATSSRGPRPPQHNTSHADSGSEEATAMREEQSEHYRMLLVGKTGSGKSTTGNTIFGEELFASDISFGSVTSECELRCSDKGGRVIEIMDCPGLYDTGKSQEEIGTFIVQAVACMHPGPDAVLFVAKISRFTEEEYGAYKRLKALFDDSITKYMIILFTHGDELERQKKMLCDLLKTAPKDLKHVLSECRHAVFNNIAADTRPQVESLLDTVRRMKRQNGKPYVCPKYKKIGDGLEEEVARRLEEVNKKDLARQKYVQDLEKKTRAAAEEMARTKREQELRERERELRMKGEERRRQQELEELIQVMREQQISAERQAQKERERKDKMEREKQQYMMKLQRQRERDLQEMMRRQAEREELEEEQRRAERQDQERRQRQYEQEMREMKQRIAQRKEPGFFEKHCTIS